MRISDWSSDVCSSDLEETAYLCAAANRFFEKMLSPADVVHSSSGVRPLYDDGAAESTDLTRGYVLELDKGELLLLSSLGGNITTARHIAEDAMARLAEALKWDCYHSSRALTFTDTANP